MVEISQLVMSTAKKVELQWEVEKAQQHLEALVQERTFSLAKTLEQLRIANQVKSQSWRWSAMSCELR